MSMRFAAADLEAQFRAYAEGQQLAMLRRSTILGLVLYPLFGILDLLVAHDQLVRLSLLRFAVFVPIGLAVLGGSYVKGLARHAAPLALAVIFAAGFGVILMMGLVPLQAQSIYAGGVILVLLAGYTAFGLRALFATLVCWSIVIAFELASLLFISAPLAVFVGHNLLFISANVIGMVAAWALEGRARQAFLHLCDAEYERGRLADANRRLEELVVTDPLTGLYNRRQLEMRLRELVATARRRKRPASVIILDLDGFKRVNDSHGHLAGDDILVRVAGCIRQVARQTDLAFRIGGDEFCLLLDDTDGPGAVRLAERLLSALAQARPADAPGWVGFSAGVATTQGGEEPGELLAAADRRLYSAKLAGKGRVVAQDAAPPA
jgi:diguanylate cyclase (GGDEF)-like protein